MDGQTKEGLWQVKITKTKILNLSQFFMQNAEMALQIYNKLLFLSYRIWKESRKNKPPFTGRVERSAEKKSPLTKPLL